MNENTGASAGRSRPRRLRAVALAAVLAGTAVGAAGRRRLGFPSSGIDVNSPQFQSAAKTCGEPVPPSGG